MIGTLGSFFSCQIYFDSRVKEFLKQKTRLIMATDQLQKDVEDAKAQERGIRGSVEPWLKEANQVLETLRTLEENIQDSERGLTSRLNWIQRLCLSKEMEAQEQKIVQLIWSSHYDRVVFGAATRGENELLSSSYYMASQSLKSAFAEITDAMKDNSGTVIVVYGKRGAGKTTLARLVGEIAEEHLQFKVVRLFVSQCATTGQIQDTLAGFLRLKFEKETEEGRAEELQHRLKIGDRMLLILEDFHNELNLESIGIPYLVGCKVLLTTSDTQVCSSTGSSKVIELGPLLQDEALKLLEKNLSQIITSDIRQIASQVAEECKSSPLAIIILARALREKVLNEWTNAYQSLISELKEGESEEVRIVYRSVKLSYDNLEETKICFLLCSLFPKYYPIAVQDLIRYAWGLRIYQGIDSIEEVSRTVNDAIEELKDSFLLLEHGKAHVQMQTVVHEAALWIASKKESILRIKAVAGLWERPKNEELESYIAISYVGSKPVELHEEKLGSKKLQILFLGGNGCKKISNEFLKWLKALKVLALHHGDLSANSLHNLTNLRALHLEHCKLNDLSSLGKLKALEILSFQGSDITELPDEIGELDNLRLLDLFDCQKLHRIPLSLIRKLSRLEELYFSGLSFEEWWSGEKSAEGSNLNPPTKIVSPSSLATSKPLKVSVFSQNQSEERNWTVKSLERDYLVCYENDVVPNLIQKVKKMKIICCDQLPAVFQNGSFFQGMEENSKVLSSDLTCLELEELPQLRRIWSGQTNNVSLQNLSTLKLKHCNGLKFIFSASLFQSLKQLQTLEIHCCNDLELILSNTEDDLDIDVNESHPPLRQPSLCMPRLKPLRISQNTTDKLSRKIRRITTYQILSKLTKLEISSCPKLAQVFSFEDAADGKEILPKLTTLEISSCPKLAQVFSFEDAADEKGTELLQLEKLSLKELRTLKTLCSGKLRIKLPSLKQFEVGECPQFSNDVISEVIRGGRLEELRLFKRDQLCGEIFELSGSYILSSLKQLQLEEINELQVIWKEPIRFVILQNFTRLELVKCNKLRVVFSLLHARNMLLLSHLVVKECKDLEHIASHDHIVTQYWISSSSSSRFKPVYFPNLEEISIEECNNLKSLFLVSIIPKLKTLRVKGAFNLKEIFSQEGEATVKSEEKKELWFPKLEVLHLEKLRNLVTLVPVGYACAFPVLKSLKVMECPSLDTSFSARSKKISLSKKELFQELPAIDGDTDWSR